jgi:hypothetical protein
MLLKDFGLCVFTTLDFPVIVNGQFASVCVCVCVCVCVYKLFWLTVPWSLSSVTSELLINFINIRFVSA